MFAGVSGEVVYSPTGGELYEDEFTFTGVGIKAGVRVLRFDVGTD
jgi:hypothetical protein